MYKETGLGYWLEWLCMDQRCSALWFNINLMVHGQFLISELQAWTNLCFSLIVSYCVWMEVALMVWQLQASLSFTFPRASTSCRHKNKNKTRMTAQQLDLSPSFFNFEYRWLISSVFVGWLLLRRKNGSSTDRRVWSPPPPVNMLRRFWARH